jgi:NAD+ kinase
VSGQIRVLSHGRPADTRAALFELAALAAAHGVALALDPEETAKHALAGPLDGIDGLAVDVPADAPVRMCITLGGDGTILRALRIHAGRSVPVFAVNYGQVGFLATVEPSRMRDGFERALAGQLDVLRLPAIEVECTGAIHTGLNDLALHRRLGGRVAELSYSVGGEQVGSVRCDGLVVATPAGSTGYNLANGGPVMAWGVAGMVVSFISPHSLSARALVIAPDDLLTVHNSSREALAMAIDGRPSGEIPPGAMVRVRFADDVAMLMQMEGSSFYRRLRDKFGALSR